MSLYLRLDLENASRTLNLNSNSSNISTANLLLYGDLASCFHNMESIENRLQLLVIPKTLVIVEMTLPSYTLGV